MTKRIKNVCVLNAWESKPLYQGDYNEDGERPVLRHDHAWFILVTLEDGTCWFSRQSTPFVAYIVHNPNEVTPLSKPETAMGKMLRQGYQKYDRDKGKTDDEWSPLFQAGPRHVTDLEGLIARTRMEERAEAIRQARVLDPDSAEWGRWPYSAYGSDAWEAEMYAHEMNERRNPNNW